MCSQTAPPVDYSRLAGQIRDWAAELGFQQTGISDTELSRHEHHLEKWLAKGYHGEMDYMHKHGQKRSRPDRLVPGTRRVISVRMDYFPPAAADAQTVLDNPQKAYISRYALGRDYHKLMRRRLQKLAARIQDEIGEFGYRAFVDSAPVLEKALAEKAGLGWIGKHSNLIHPRAGSWFFLGEIYTDLPLPVDEQPLDQHCGTCRACLDCCPTGAIVAPFQVDARRCIAYLTIELKTAIPVEFRPAIGNRIYGCDDCQLCCPWNRFARPTGETDFFHRPPLDDADLTELFSWDEAHFLQRTEGSAIRRIGYLRWLRNLAVALGNHLRENRADSSATRAICRQLREKLTRLQREGRDENNTEMVAEHIRWALDQAAPPPKTTE